MPNFTGKSGGGPHHMKGGYGKGKNPIMLTKEGKEKIMASNANPNFKEAIANSPIDMYGKSPMPKYKKSPMPKYKKPAAPKAGQTAGQIVKRERLMI
mgnify:CR=1 FL=1|tara:strand:+ start:49 stop:339 length:291 start_codon:yes stop_codon:yes gene_type:complete